MCGIFGSVDGGTRRTRLAVAAMRHRGPDAAHVFDEHEVFLGHARLAIIDVGKRSEQPMTRGSTTVSFNGEIWNWQEVRAELEGHGLGFTTDGDAEVVARALDFWGEQALPRFQGMFAIAWTRGDGVLLAARDRFGEVPLHFHKGWPVMAASEVKALYAAGAALGLVDWVPPGAVLEVRGGVARLRRWYDVAAEPDRSWNLETAAGAIGDLVAAGARERAISDVPVCTLLSGGIDSAAVALELKKHFPDLVAYVAVMNSKSPDLRAARVAAEAVGVELREVAVAAPSDGDLAKVVRAIEMPHKAQVEIGWACLALARRMRDDGFKVTFSGEGSDELWASYGFAYHALKTQGWHEYRRDLFVGQHRKNFARCNKVFMAHGVECRLPFLSTPLVELALALPRAAVQDGARRPKAVIQDAYAGRLPDLVVRRSKLAFQDGLGLKRAISDAREDPKALYVEALKRLFPGLAA